MLMLSRVFLQDSDVSSIVEWEVGSLTWMDGWMGPRSQEEEDCQENRQDKAKKKKTAERTDKTKDTHQRGKEAKRQGGKARQGKGGKAKRQKTSIRKGKPPLPRLLLPCLILDDVRDRG